MLDYREDHRADAMPPQAAQEGPVRPRRVISRRGRVRTARARVPARVLSAEDRKVIGYRATVRALEDEIFVSPADRVPADEIAARATVGVGTAIAGAIFVPAGVALAIANGFGGANLRMTSHAVALVGTFAALPGLV